MAKNHSRHDEIPHNHEHHDGCCDHGHEEHHHHHHDHDHDHEHHDGCCDVEAPFVRQGPKVGRNDPCPCQSGKKFKKCCINLSE